MLRQVGETDCVRREVLRERLRILERAVGHDHALDARFGQVTCGEFDRLSGADEENAGLPQVREQALGQAHGGERDRNRACADARVGAHALGHGERLLQQALHRRAQAARVARRAVCILDLPQDLRFPEHERIEPRGDAEQVPDRRIVRVQVKELIDSLFGQTVLCGQPLSGDAFCARVDVDVQFGAVAGRQDQGLVHSGLAGQIRQCLRRRFRRESYLLAQCERRVQMVESEGDEGHACDNRIS